MQGGQADKLVAMNLHHGFFRQASAQDRFDMAWYGQLSAGYCFRVCFSGEIPDLGIADE